MLTRTNRGVRHIFPPSHCSKPRHQAAHALFIGRARGVCFHLTQGKRMFKKTIAAVTLAAFAIGSVALAQNPPVSPSPVKRTIFGKTEVPGGTHEVVSAVVEIAAGFKAGRHFHPGVVQVQMLDGEFWLALDGQPEKSYTAGQSFEVPNKAIHNEGALGDKPAKLIAIYVVEKGQPLVNPVK
jgi:quercetin dioxygenase-like cupin family protein